MDARIARRAVAGALIAGVVADAMFDRIDLGSNVPLATAAILALVTWFGPGRRPADRLDMWLPVVALVASLGPMLRTDPTVVGLDLLLVAGGVAAWSFAVSGVAVTRRSARAVVLLGAVAGAAVAAALPWLLRRSLADGALSRGTRQIGRLAPVARGAIIAIPVVAGFAFLLGSADAVFGRAIDDALDLPFNLDELFRRGWFSILAAALVAGPIAIAVGAAGPDGQWLFTTPPPPAPGPAGPTVAATGSTPAGSAPPDSTPGGSTPEGWVPVTVAAPAGPVVSGAPVTATASAPRRSGVTETLVVLVAVDLLFAAFAAVQVIFLFGGADTLAAIGMTYSDYARQGYFQLVFVVGLAGLLLLGAHEVMGRTRQFVIAGLALLGLTGVILASAAVRLGLYQGAYGWTELRFYVASSIAWLAAGVAIAVGLVVANRMRWVAHGLAASAVAITLAVSAIGPQAFVVGQNLARLRDPSLVAPGGRSGFDAAYALTLGDDAVPDLVASLDLLDPLDRELVLADLRWRKAILDAKAPSSGPLSWNLAREQARAALGRLPER